METCHDEKLLAFACKRRAFCPSEPARILRRLNLLRGLAKCVMDSATLGIFDGYREKKYCSQIPTACFAEVTA